MSEVHYICVRNECHSPDVLWWGLVAAIWVKTYCYFIEKGEKFSTDAVQKGRKAAAGSILADFC